MSNIKEVNGKPMLYLSLSQPICSMAAMLGNSVTIVVRMRPRAIPLAMITMGKSTHGFPFLYGYGAPLGGPLSRRSSAIKNFDFCFD